MPQISANVHISESRRVLEEFGATYQGIHGVYNQFKSDKKSKPTIVSGIKNITCPAGQTTAHGG